jgi:hypothetical protein
MSRSSLRQWVVLILLGATGCAWSVGGSNERISKPTIGEELIDLKRAHEQQAISDNEYDNLKNALHEAAKRR